MSRVPFIIAVDGPAASGKGTIAARLAAIYDLPALDSGLLYRAVGVLLEQQGGSPDDSDAAAKVARDLTAEALGDPAFRTRAAGEAASRVAIHSAVRLALRQMQQNFAHRPGGAVIDGRDIGTVIAPDAPAKLFVTARPEVRAARRFRQLQGQGESVTFEDILEDILRRDARDGGRSDSPMIQAKDAALLDTSQMTIDQAADAARRMVEAARARWLES